MKKSIISLVLVCSIAASFTACSSEGTAETKTYVLEQFNNNISCRVTVSEELFNSVEIGLEGSTSVTSAQAKADEKMAILTDYDFQSTTFAGQILIA